jgi:hypothetical protein
LQNLILSHIYKKVVLFFEPFRPRLSSKFAKSANMIKNAELDADFESFEKVAKNPM